MSRLIAALVAACLLAAPAGAADAPRKIDFSAVMLDENDKPYTDCARADASTGKCLEERDITLGRLALRALTVQFPNEAALSGEEQVRRALLAQAIYKAKDMAIDAGETDLICTAIAKIVNRLGLPALVTLRAWELLDPARVKKP